jgi:hypothetical protein
MTLSYEEMMAQFAETRAQLAETRAQIATRNEQTSRNIDRPSKKREAISDTLGKFAVESIEPALIKLFTEKGIYLSDIASRVTKHLPNGNFLYEIDLLAVNGQFAVVTEVKSTLRKDDIDEHIGRLTKVQQNPVAALYGKTVYGAIGAMIAPEEVCRYAAKKGFFVIVQSGENIKIDNEPNFKGKTWIMPTQN